MNIDKSKLLLIKEINIDGIGLLKQPKILDILTIGLENFNQLIMPYQLTVEMLNIQDSYKADIKTFDIFFSKDETGNMNEVSIKLLANLIKSVEFFIDDKIIKVNQADKNILLSKGGKIDRNNFDELSEIILNVTKSEKFKVEKEDVNKSERQKEIDRKLAEGRRKKQKQDAITLLDMINILIHSKNTKFTYDSILELTYFQLINSYEVVMSIERYDINLACLNGFFDIKSLDLVHWSEKIRELKPKVIQEGTL